MGLNCGFRKAGRATGEQKAHGVPGTSKQDGAQWLQFLSEQSSKLLGLGVCDKDWEQGWGMHRGEEQIILPGRKESTGAGRAVGGCTRGCPGSGEELG